MNDKRSAFTLVAPTIVANNFIKKAQEDDIEDLTPVKLQKLVYFLYRSYLKTTGKKLFSERFETWKYGPVIPSIYAEFNSYGKDPIKTYAQDSQGIIYTVVEKGDFSKCIDDVWRDYKNMSGAQLTELTHQSGTAWSIAKDNEKHFLEDEDIKREI